jgi:hypothetical protein
VWKALQKVDWRAALWDNCSAAKKAEWRVEYLAVKKAERWVAQTAVSKVERTVVL